MKIIITGATGKIGEAIAKSLYQKSHDIVLIARNETKVKNTIDKIKATSANKKRNNSISYMIADLSQQEDILKISQDYKNKLDILINNAAITPVVREESIEGIEMQFAVNVLGYYRMSKLFLNHLKKSSQARIINVASYYAGGLDINDLQFKKRRYDNNSAYRQSKQANRMLSVYFSDLYKNFNISVNVCHPGEVNSKLSNDLGFTGHESPELGAMTPVYLTEIDHNITGKYFEYKKIKPCHFSKDKLLINQLAKICEKFYNM